MPDSRIATNGGPGQVNSKRLRQIARSWGSMPEKERRQVLQDLTRGMSDKNRQAIEAYFKKIVDAQNAKTR